MNKEIREALSAHATAMLECAVQLYIAGEHTEVRKILTGLSIITSNDTSKLVKYVKREATRRQHLFVVEMQEALDALFADSTIFDTKEGE